MRLPLLGRQSVLAALAALAVAAECGLDLDAACMTLAGVHGAAHRLTPVDVPAHRLTILDDCYNANPASMQLALETASALRRTGERLMLVLGDMLELGGLAQRRHTELGATIAGLDPAPDVVVAVGQFASSLTRTADEVGIAAHGFADVDAALPHVRTLVQDGGADGYARQLMLVKASRGVHLERIVDALVGTSAG